METTPPKIARRAAVLLRAFAANFDGKTAPASIVERLGKLDLKAVADVLDRAENVLNRTAPDRLQARIAELESSLQRARRDVKALTPARQKPVKTTPGGEGGGFRRPYYMTRFPARVCLHCRKHFLSARPDAKTCSPKCRVAFHRKRKAKPDFAAKTAGKVAAEVIPSGPYLGKRKPRPGVPESASAATKREAIRAQAEHSDDGQWWKLPANLSDGELKRFEQAKAKRKK